MNEKQKYLVGELLKELHVDKAVEEMIAAVTAERDALAAQVAEHDKMYPIIKKQFDNAVAERDALKEALTNSSALMLEIVKAGILPNHEYSLTVRQLERLVAHNRDLLAKLKTK